MQFRRRRSTAIKRILAASAFLASSFAAVNAAAAAESDCNGYDEICLWGNNDYLWLIFDEWENSGNYVLTGDANNQMDSWKNRSEDYDGSGYGNSNFTRGLPGVRQEQEGQQRRVLEQRRGVLGEDRHRLLGHRA